MRLTTLLTDPRRRRTSQGDEQFAAVAHEGSRLLAAPTAELPAPAGKSPLEAIGSAFDEAGGRFRFSPEARQGIEQAAARAEARDRAALYGDNPYPEIPADQVAVYRHAAANARPRPVFHAARRSVAPVTAPMAVLPVNTMVPPPAPAPEAVIREAAASSTETPDLAVLRRVRAAMDKKWRIEAFVTDKRELPLFGALTKELGWQGLHMSVRPAGWQRWTTIGWAARERALADVAYRAARAQVLGELDAIRARVDGTLTAIGGAL